MKDINTEIKKLLAERDMALNSLAGVQCHPRLIDALRDRVYQFYDQPIKRLEACFQVAEYWQGQAAPNKRVQSDPLPAVDDGNNSNSAGG